MDWAWQPEAECPRWREFLGEVFPGDGESQKFIEEWLGYCMTSDTRFQKAAMYVGETRGGKGTIVQVMEGLLGEGNYVGLQLTKWLRGEKSTAVLLGKRAIVFGDVRLKEGQNYGQNWAPGGLDEASQELLLKITGNDTVSIRRMYTDAWVGRLPRKVTVVTNKVLNLNDDVLVKRFVVVPFTQSFEDRKDVDLYKEGLRPELPGIAARCVAAYGRLVGRGRFIQPASGLRLASDVMAVSDPLGAAVRTLFEPVADGMVEKERARKAVEAWARANYPQLVVTQRDFFSRLRKVQGFAGVTAPDYRPVIDGRQNEVYRGLRLREVT